MWFFFKNEGQEGRLVVEDATSSISADSSHVTISASASASTSTGERTFLPKWSKALKRKSNANLVYDNPAIAGMDLEERRKFGVQDIINSLGISVSCEEDRKREEWWASWEE